jgi:hypothetical protein
MKLLSFITGLLQQGHYIDHVTVGDALIPPHEHLHTRAVAHHGTHPRDQRDRVHRLVLILSELNVELAIGVDGNDERLIVRSIQRFRLGPR